MKKGDPLEEPDEEIIEIYPKRSYGKLVFSFLAVLLFGAGYCLGGSCSVTNAGLLGNIFASVNSVSREALSQVFTNTSPTNEKLVATVNLNTSQNEEFVSTIKKNEILKSETVMEERIVSTDQKPTENSPPSLLNKPVKEKAAANNCSFNPDLISAHKDIIFNEIAWMGSKDGSRHEWMELKNISDSEINLAGWQVTDTEGEVEIIFQNRLAVPSGGLVLLERGEDAVPQMRADLLYSGNLENEGDGLEIFSPQCNLSDKIIANPTWPAGIASPKYLTAERGIDLSWHNYSGAGSDGIFGTPKAINSPSPANNLSKTQLSVNTNTHLNEATSSSQDSPNTISPTVSGIITTDQSDGVPRREVQSTSNSGSGGATTTENVSAPAINHILISEILYNAQGADAGKEFIELYNPTSSDLDLKDWSLKNASTSLAKLGSVSQDKLIIKSQGYFLIGLSSYNMSPAADVVRSANLPNTAANILLYDSNGTLVESVSYDNSVGEGESYERDSWSSTSFHTEANPNPQNSGL